MMQKGYGRLLAALVAAGGVHAVLFFSGAVPLAVKNSTLSLLQVDMVVAEQPSPVQPKTVQTDEGRKTAGQLSAVEMKRPSHSDAPQIKRHVAEVAEPAPQVAYHADDGAGKEAVAATKPAAAAEPLSVPADIQAEILAQVSYPRLARKRGWEGEVHLQFDVSNRSVADVAMLKGSEHPVLNEAAKTGLLRMRTVALADGRYWMPVVFQLR